MLGGREKFLLAPCAKNWNRLSCHIAADRISHGHLCFPVRPRSTNPNSLFRDRRPSTNESMLGFGKTHRSELLRTKKSAIRCDSIRFDSIRFDSIRFDSIRFDSIRFDSIRFDAIRCDGSSGNLEEREALRRLERARRRRAVGERPRAVRRGAERRGAWPGEAVRPRLVAEPVTHEVVLAGVDQRAHACAENLAGETPPANQLSRARSRARRDPYARHR